MTTQSDRVRAARADLIVAIGAATGGAVDEEREAAILNAIESLIAAASTPPVTIRVRDLDHLASCAIFSGSSACDCGAVVNAVKGSL